MKDTRHYDYLLVGQGLAGSMLAWQLIGAGQRVLVIDNDNPCAASRVAAGLVNPVTGKRLVRDTNVMDLLVTARDCYTRLGKQFDRVFWHDRPMLRLFDSEEIKQYWQKRRGDAAYRPFIGDALSADECGCAQGGFLQYETAYLSTVLLLQTVRRWLAEQAALLTAQFDYQELQTGEPLRWRDYTADRLIFCEGARIDRNPWFNTLPMQPAQGEILTLRTRDSLPPWIINGGRWLLPVAQDTFKLGATYVWPTADRPLTEQTTAQGKAILLEAMTRLWPAITDYQLVAHEAGIRPNSRDKQPLIGFHPRLPRLAVFNGFGSRGSLLIPYYARQFVEVLLNGAQLEPAVAISRVMA